ncbi:hypothetical protein BOTBODRAFT_34499 [Botryobasidium botryosum FD-172 SS1]|uniref:Double-strand break repair protein n=1 Tax=Botryobasidium botryosum (strain FD-172 SS1) TaxID=930990 RepID=A0A067MAD8_BOTB1|nr:hypothetical protein BOTBODRAFT_34499 [Botryobasidium botryosum FD-172 SS1]
MVATDNHIGYMERDPIRGQDSINSFEEVLKLAVKLKVDMILLGGDLFHENRPSRECLYRTIALLREYTFGDRPIEIELLSDPNEGKAHGFSFPAVNYEDPNLNVSIPVFSIHGNHDDPQGAGHDGALCALDIVSAAGVLNYFGKVDLPSSDEDAATTGITIKPILLQKGNTRLALYGMGNIRDQRLHFELRNNRVRMFMPNDRTQWFNILVLHQNRVKHGPQESVPEGMFDDSIDLVIWGHEHDCRILPEEVAGKDYKIIQPGSSVATSLAEGESIEKHVALLEIKDNGCKIMPIALRTVRPFSLGEVNLMDAARDDGLDLKDQMEIKKYLRGKVEDMILQAKSDWEDRNASAVAAGEESMKPMLPLIRLKVETTGVSEMTNPVRFSQEFQGMVANPRDVVVFFRKKSESTSRSKVVAEKPDLSIDDPDISVAEKLSKIRVATLVKEYLAAQELQILLESGMSDAIQTFVDKDDPHSISTHVTKELDSMFKNMKPTDDLDEETLEDEVARMKEQQEKEYQEKRSARNKGKAKAQVEEDDESGDSMEIDMAQYEGMGSDEEEEPEPPKRRAAAAKKAPAAKAKAATIKSKAPAASKSTTGRGKKKAQVIEDSDEEEDEIEDEDIMEVEEDPKPKRSRAAVLSTPAKKTTARKAPAKQTTLNLVPRAQASTRAPRTAAKNAKSKMQESIEISD